MSSYQIEELGISYICKLNCEEDSHAHSSIYKSEKLWIESDETVDKSYKNN